MSRPHSDAEIAADRGHPLAARPCCGRLRFATLIGLPAVTGIRVGEAIALDNRSGLAGSKKIGRPRCGGARRCPHSANADVDSAHVWFDSGRYFNGRRDDNTSFHTYQGLSRLLAVRRPEFLGLEIH
jgi:hypothetical protein